MANQVKLTVSHAPFWHNQTSISQKSYNIMLACLPAVIFGIFCYGISAFAVVALSVSTAILWEVLFNLISKRKISIGDGNAALIGLVFAMLLPATAPWWLVITGTFLCIFIGKQIFGGIGCNPFNPVIIGTAMVIISWSSRFDFNEALVVYNNSFPMAYPLSTLKHFGVTGISSFSFSDLLLGQQSGGIGSIFGLGIIIGGIYLIIRGFIRWEIVLSFLLGIFITAMLFHMVNPIEYASPFFHIATGYTLIGAFFLATEDSSSPVNVLAMFIYGLGCGILTILIRNIGMYVDGVLLAILLMNIINPLLDKIRPKAFGRVIKNA